MTDAEIGQAQRAARDWLKAHPESTVTPVASLPRPAALIRSLSAVADHVQRFASREAFRLAGLAAVTGCDSDS